MPERFGRWNSIYKRFNRWAQDGTWWKLLAEVQKQADAAGKINWVLADKGYPSKANRAWLRERGIAATIPERDDQIAHRRKRPGRHAHLDLDRLGQHGLGTS